MLAAFAGITASAQFHQDEFPHYLDGSIPEPGYDHKLSKKDLQLTDKFLDQYPEGTPVADRAAMQKLYEFYKNDPDGKKEWATLSGKTARIISAWDIRNGAKGSRRYIYFLSALKDFSVVYMLTGNKMVSDFIRGHLRKIAPMPLDFWVHAELRGLNPKKPKGCLETAQLNEMLGFAIAACGKDMTPEEKQTIIDAWYEKGHKTGLNWLSKYSSSNWTAVIATGSLYSSKFFGDENGKKIAMGGLRYYADNAFMPDGSYCEGAGYFDYPVGVLTNALLIMSKEEIEEVFGDCYLKNSMSWVAYGCLFNTDAEGNQQVWRISYGDNGFGAKSFKGMHKPSLFTKMVYNDPVSQWLREKFGSRNSSTEVLLSAKFPGRGDESLSPEEAKFPHAKAFQSGDTFIRSSWEDNATVFALKAGDCGESVKQKGHCRPELNSIALGAFGEYIIVTPGSASYRHQIHWEYDEATKSANTITIDGMNQKINKPATKKAGKWDNSSFWVQGTGSHADVTKCENYPDGGALIRSEAQSAYHIEMKEASRTVRYIPEGGFFIMSDKMTPADNESHRYDYRLHIFNRDGATVVSGKPALIKVQRGNADLYVAMNSNAKLSFAKEDGYLHAPGGRDAEGDGGNQGTLGSAIGLDWSVNTKAWDVVSVIYPKKTGSPAPKIKFAGGKVTVDGKTYDIPE